MAWWVSVGAAIGVAAVILRQQRSASGDRQARGRSAVQPGGTRPIHAPHGARPVLQVRVCALVMMVK